MYSNGRITAPVSIWDVRQALSTNEPDEGRLCVHNAINRWAKCKPIKAAKIEPLNYAVSEQVTNYHAGLSILVADSESAFINAVKAAFVDNDYKDKDGYPTMVKYDRPTGGMLSPYRITDFNGYNIAAYLDYTVHNESASGENQGDGLPVSPTWSRNMIIDLTGTPQDQTLADDSARLIYYDNFMSATLSARENLHVYDLISWWQNGQTVLRGMVRGVMLWNSDVEYVFIETIPWATNTDLINELASSTGKAINVVEFYYKNGRYYCIPQFSYTTTCWSRFVFTGYPSYVPCSIITPTKQYDAIEILGVSLDGTLDSFKTLYLGLQMKLPTSDIWEKVSIYGNNVSQGEIVIKSLGVVEEGLHSVYTYDLDGDGIDEGVTLVYQNDYPSGTRFRIIFHGIRAAGSADETFYVTPSQNEMVI